MAHDITYLFQFGAKSSKCNIVSDSSILNIKRIDTALDQFHIKKRKNIDNINLIVVIALIAEIDNWACT